MCSHWLVSISSRHFDSEWSRVHLKVGKNFTWTSGYKVFEGDLAKYAIAYGESEEIDMVMTNAVWLGLGVTVLLTLGFTQLI